MEQREIESDWGSALPRVGGLAPTMESLLDAIHGEGL